MITIGFEETLINKFLYRFLSEISFNNTSLDLQYGPVRNSLWQCSIIKFPRTPTQCTYTRHIPFVSRFIWRIFERSRDCPEKQPNSPHVDFTKRRGKEKERKRGEAGAKSMRANVRPISEVSLSESLDGVVRRQPDKGRVP